MSRFAVKEPLAVVQRHFSTSSPPRSMISPHVHSNLLANFDEEFARLQQEDRLSYAATQQTSSTLRMALNTPGTIANGTTNSVFRAAAAPGQTDKQPGKQPNIPLYSYKMSSPAPVLVYIREEAKADEQASKLKGPLGFDLEWHVIFRRGASERKTAILQLCDDRRILIIQLSVMKSFPQKVKAILEAHDTIKMGVNILNDGRKLRRDFGILPAGLLELSHLANLADPSRVPTKRMISLQRIVEMYTRHTLSKGRVRTSNWEAYLNEEQLEYAANDAHSALQVYNELMRIAKEKGLSLKPVVTPSSTVQSTMGVDFVDALDATGRRASPILSTFANGTTREPSAEARSKRLPQAVPACVARFAAVPVTSLEQRMGNTVSKKPVRGQHLRAYQLWHEQKLPLPEICSTLRSPEHPLAKSTVISYVVEALKADESLAFSRQHLKELAMLEYGSWQRHRWWIDGLNRTNRGQED